MKKYILIATLFVSLFTQSQVYVNGEKVAESGASDISIVNGDVYIDGKSVDELTEEIAAEVEKLDGEQSEVKSAKDPNLYETKNVDAYNKWYNIKGKKMIEEEKKKTKNVFLWIVGILGAGAITASLIFIISEIKQRIKKKRSQRVYSGETQKIPKEVKPKIPAPEWSSPLHHDMNLPEVDSPIRKK